MEYYCGTDIIEVGRVKDAITGTEGFKEKIYTLKEIEAGDLKSDKIRYQYYAGRFAAKEAIYKAVSNIKNDLPFWEVEILNDLNNKNRPVVYFKNNELLDMQQEGKITVDVSISHIADYAVANAVVKVDRT